MNCKRKECKNQALNGEKYCNYHQSKKEERNRNIGSGVLIVASVIVTAFSKKLLGGSNKG